MSLSLKRIFSPQFILVHYFLLYCIGAVVARLTGKGYVISLLVPMLLFYVSIFNSKKNSGIKSMDVMWFIMIIWIAITWLFNEYSHQFVLIARCIIGQIAFMMAYWIGRDPRCRSYLARLFENAKIPVLICCILGLWWFFSPPGWYMREIEEEAQSGTLQSIAELSRLKSFFTSPYDLAYFNAFLSIYIFNVSLVQKRKSFFNVVLMILIIACLLFGMMRAPMAAALIGLFGAYSAVCVIRKKYFLLILPVIFLAVLYLLFLFLAQFIDADIYDFLLYKFDSVSDDSSGFLEERFNIYDADMLFFGDGAGRHAFYADDYVKGSSMRDGEYIKIIVEQGLIGLSFYIIFFVQAFYKCIRNLKYLSLELCIISFCMLSMIGANSLTTSDKHGFIFWMVFGMIAAFKRPKKKRKSKLKPISPCIKEEVKPATV